MEKHSYKTYLRIVGEEQPLRALARELSAFTAVKEQKTKDGIDLILGESKACGVDVNESIAVTIADFGGKEAWLKEVKTQYKVDILLTVLLNLYADSDEPYPILSPTKQTVAFLYESDVTYDLDYYVF